MEQEFIPSQQEGDINESQRIPSSSSHDKNTSSQSKMDFSQLTRPSITTDLTENPLLEILLLDLDSEASNINDNKPAETVIRLYGITENQNTVSVLISNFLCHLSIEYPFDLPDPSSEDLERLKSRLNTEMKENGCISSDNIIPKVEFKKESILRNYLKKSSAVLVSHIVVYFSHPHFMKVFNELFNLDKAKQSLKNKNLKEDESLEDILSIQFLMDTKFKVMSWIQVKLTKFSLSEQALGCQIEVQASVEDLSPISSEKEPKTLPQLRILSLNVECDCLPQEKPSESQSHKILQITNVYQMSGQSLLQKKIFTMGSCMNIGDSEVHSYDSETDMLNEWKTFFMSLDPDVVVGYNLVDFGFRSLQNRSKTLEIKDFGILGRVESFRAINNNYDSPLLNGRIVQDVLWFLMSRYPTLEGGHGLKNVSQHFLGDQKSDFSHDELSYSMKLSIYCLHDADLALRLFKKLEILEFLRVKTNRIGVPIKYAINKREPTISKNLNMEIEEEKLPQIDFDKLVAEHISDSLIFKVALPKGFQNQNEMVVEKNEASRMDVKLYDPNEHSTITGHLSGQAYANLNNSLQQDDYLMITEFTLEETENREKTINALQASILDVSAEAVQVFEFLSHTVKIQKLLFEVQLDPDSQDKSAEIHINVKSTPQTKKGEGRAKRKDSEKSVTKSTGKPEKKIDKEQKLEKGKKKGKTSDTPQKKELKKEISPQKSSSTSGSRKKEKIYDYFKLVSVKRSLTNENPFKPSTTKSSEDLSLKRSFSALEKSLSNQSDSIDLKPTKNLKGEDSNNDFLPIAKLSPLIQDWAIKARVYGKSTKLEVLKEGVYHHQFVAEVIDEAGTEISIVFQGRDMVDEYYDQIVISGIYIIGGGEVKDKRVRSYRSKNHFQIFYDSQSLIRLEPQNDSYIMPKMIYHYSPLSTIKDCRVDSDVSVIGLVAKVKVEQITKKDKTVVAAKKVLIIDQALELVELVLWDRQSDIKIHLFDILLISRGKVRKYLENKHLALTQHSIIMTNYFPNYEGGSEFYNWIQDFFRDKVDNYIRLQLFKKTLSTTLNDILEHPTDTETFISRAYVTYIDPKSQSYQACPNCRRSIAPNANSSQISQPMSQVTNDPSAPVKSNVPRSGYYEGAPIKPFSKDGKKESVRLCVYCANYITEPQTIPLLSVRLSDPTGTLNITAFGNVANVLQPTDDEASTYPVNCEFKFKVRSGLDFQSEKKYTVYDVKPLQRRVP